MTGPGEDSHASGAVAQEEWATGAAVKAALEYAGLPQDALTVGSHPDSGQECLCLAADIRQYSAFLACLTLHHGEIRALTPLIGGVQSTHDEQGDMRLWFSGL